MSLPIPFYGAVVSWVCFGLCMMTGASTGTLQILFVLGCMQFVLLGVRLVGG